MRGLGFAFLFFLRKCMLKDVPHLFIHLLPVVNPAAHNSVSYQIVVFRHIAVKHSNRNEWDSEVWRKRAINNLSSHRRWAIDNRSRSDGASTCCCRRRAIDHRSLRYRGTIWKDCVNNCTRGWYKVGVFGNTSFFLSFTFFFCSFIF